MIDNKKISELLNQFANEREWAKFHTPKNLASSVSIEAAELLELFQWSKGSDWSSLNEETLREETSQELADILLYLIRFSDLSGIDLERQRSIKLKLIEKNIP